MRLELGRSQPSASWMLRIVVVDLSVALKAERDRIGNAAAGIGCGTFNVVDFHFHAAEAVTNTASTMAGHEHGLDFLLAKLVSWHVKSWESGLDRPHNVTTEPRRIRTHAPSAPVDVRRLAIIRD